MIDHSFENKSDIRNAELFRQFKPFLKPFFRSFSFCFFLILVSTVLEVVAPIWLGRIVDNLSSSKDKNVLIFYSCLYFGFMISKNLCDLTHAFWVQRNGERLAQKLRSFLFSHILKLPISFFDRTPTGRILTRIINDIKTMGELFTASISVVFLDIWIIIGTIIAMMILDWKVTLLLLIPLPFLFRSAFIVGKKTTEGYWEARKKLSEINSYLGEHYVGLKTIQMLNLKEIKKKKFEKLLQAHQDANDRSLKSFAVIQPVNNFWNGFVVAVLLIYAVFGIKAGTFSVGTLVIFLGYIRNLFQPIRDLIEKYNTFLSAKVSSQRIAVLLSEKEEVETDKKVDLNLNDPIAIEFSNLTFSYPEQKNPSLKNINFKIPAKARVGIIGPTGGGKSTLVRLLLRFYDAQEGELTLNKIPISQISLESLRRAIGVVHQDLYLFRSSLRENLIFENDAISDEKLIEYLKVVGLWSRVEHRGGLNFKLEENGNNLSNGEKQLINMVRILILNPPFLIFDEATSSLDTLLEDQILIALNEVMKDRTCLIIAHRPSTLKNCDSIYRVENGSLHSSNQKNFNSFFRFEN